MNPLIIIIVGIALLGFGIGAGIAYGLRILAGVMATAISGWKLPPAEPAPQAKRESNVIPINQEKTHCNYPECYCPLDAPYDPDRTWCAIGLPKDPRS